MPFYVEHSDDYYLGHFVNGLTDHLEVSIMQAMGGGKLQHFCSI